MYIKSDVYDTHGDWNRSLRGDAVVTIIRALTLQNFHIADLLRDVR